MRFDVYRHLPDEQSAARSRDELFRQLIQLRLQIADLSTHVQKMETRMSEQLDTLVEQVHANTSHTQSLIQLVNGLADRVEELKDDPAALQGLADEIRTTNEAIVNSVAANTPLADDIPDDDGAST